jgi:serine phosphatase RsbU (regulator of sigma subunit)
MREVATAESESVSAIAPPLRLAPGNLSPEGAEIAAGIERQMAEVQREMDALRGELGMLRRRDEALNFYMLKLDEELRLAARLQRDFLPRELPQIGRVKAHALFRPAGYVSGDLYDVVRLDDRRLGFYMADAVGHGVPAAMLTLFVKHALVTREPTPTGYRILTPAEALSRLNDAVIRQELSQAAFATAVYGIIDAETLEVTVARAGHPNPVILRENGGVEDIEADGPLLGIFPGEAFADRTAKLAPGDRLFFYTDGVEVAFSDDCKDTRRWRHELHARRHLPPEDLLSDLIAHLDGESGSLTPKDDLTMLMVEIQP